MTDLSLTLRPTAAGTSPTVADVPLVPRPKEVSIRVQGATIQVSTGTPLYEILPREIGGVPVVSALLGRRPVSLTARVTWEAEVEPILLDSLEGQRVHRMSQALLLLEAAEVTAPDADVRLAHSVGFGRRVHIGLGFKQRAEELAERLQAAMVTMVEQDHPLTETWAGVTEAMEHFRRVGWHDTVELLATWRDLVVPLASYGRVQAIVMSPLLPSTGQVGGFRVLADRGGLLLLYGRDRRASARVPGTAPDLNVVPETTVENAEP
ncbi:MAG TPA: hypothetical protein VIV60_21365, partial [Polyangiaceae bacterium]